MFVDESCSELVYMRKVVRVLQMVVGGVRWRSSRRLKSYSEYLAGDNKEERRRDPRNEFLTRRQLRDDVDGSRSRRRSVNMKRFALRPKCFCQEPQYLAKYEFNEKETFA